MDVIKLPAGQSAPAAADCISIDTLPDGGFRLNANALLQCGDGEEVESVSLIGGDTYSSYEEAEAAGLAWASEHCVGTIYVSRDAPQPE